MEEDKLTKELLVMGGVYIGLEFASYYANFGSKMTIIQDSNDFIPREDAEIAELVYASMTNKPVRKYNHRLDTSCYMNRTAFIDVTHITGMKPTFFINHICCCSFILI